MLLILLGLAGLSGTVFGLGLIAGHEMAGPEPGSPPGLAAYPLPAAPASAPSEQAVAAAPAPAANPEAPAASSSENTGNAGEIAAPAKAAVASAPAVKPLPAPPVSAATPVSGPVAARRTAATGAAVASRSSRTATAAAAASPYDNPSTGASVAPPSESASAEGTADTGEEEPEAPARPAIAAVAPRRNVAAANPPAPRTGPYSVQIDAMMDRAGAQQMAQKIRAKGFEPYIVPTLVDGKTWYRLRVGHYATPQEAQAAESRLHQEFNNSSSGN